MLPKMYRTGSFSLEIKFDQTAGRATSETPDANETIRFVVLMRRFLNPLEWVHLLRECMEFLAYALRQRDTK